MREWVRKVSLPAIRQHSAMAGVSKFQNGLRPVLAHSPASEGAARSMFVRDTEARVFLRRVEVDSPWRVSGPWHLTASTLGRYYAVCTGDVYPN